MKIGIPVPYGIGEGISSIPWKRINRVFLIVMLTVGCRDSVLVPNENLQEPRFTPLKLVSVPNVFAEDPTSKKFGKKEDLSQPDQYQTAVTGHYDQVIPVYSGSTLNGANFTFQISGPSGTSMIVDISPVGAITANFTLTINGSTVPTPPSPLTPWSYSGTIPSSGVLTLSCQVRGSHSSSLFIYAYANGHSNSHLIDWPGQLCGFPVTSVPWILINKIDTFTVSYGQPANQFSVLVSTYYSGSNWSGACLTMSSMAVKAYDYCGGSQISSSVMPTISVPKGWSTGPYTATGSAALSGGVWKADPGWILINGIEFSLNTNTGVLFENGYIIKLQTNTSCVPVCPSSGTLISETCSQGTTVYTYADGVCGTYTENGEQCGSGGCNPGCYWDGTECICN